MACKGNKPLRDRDAIITYEGLIFRVLGYTHPKDAYVCDLEYAPKSRFQSPLKKAIRSNGENIYYKFYGEQVFQYVKNNAPHYLILYKPTGTKTIGVKLNQIKAVRYPQEGLKKLLQRRDKIAKTAKTLLEVIISESNLDLEDFGVFGSLLHQIYNPKYADLDFIIYGRKNLSRLLSALKRLYDDPKSDVKNEFEGWNKINPNKPSRFTELSMREYCWHMYRKKIYGVYNSRILGREIKFEFEPVLNYDEIVNDYDRLRIRRLGWVTIRGLTLNSPNRLYMPSIFRVKVFDKPKIRQIISYVEDFRGQLEEGDRFVARGYLEEVELNGVCFHQLALSYHPKYCEQLLKAEFRPDA